MHKHTVVIPTAGTGSRLGKLTENLNKSLVPYKNKPILSHIIESFPTDTKFIIPVGFLSQQVMDFCDLVYKDRNIQFVLIDDYLSSKSGPGYTVLQCLPFLQDEFWYIPCDTYYTETLTNLKLTTDTVFTKFVDTKLSHHYTMFKLSDNKICDMTFKQSQTNDWCAFTGVMFVKDVVSFKQRLQSLSSPEIIYTILNNTNASTLNSWLDFGNLEIYNEEVNKTQKYDFTKTDEITYFTNDKTIKWFVDESISKKKYLKTVSYPKVFPNNCVYKGQWLCYDYHAGDVIYNNYSIGILKDLLNWLETNVWIQKKVNIEHYCKEFYKTKTLDRVEKLLKKYPNIQDAVTVNSIPVKSYKHYIENIDWNLLESDYRAGFMHGDLQFDNIILGDDNTFKIIDWRHEFAGLVDTGDIYYDLAKLMGGFLINYKLIKNNDFFYDFNNGNVKLSVPSIKDSVDYIKVIKEFCETKNYNFKKVQLLVPLIFWNMAPLHTPDFDLLLWYYAMQLFEECV